VSNRRRRLVGVLALGMVVLLLWLPLYAEAFWLQTGLFAMSAAIGAIGLQLLVGVTGQLSLAHAFYLAVGAYGYCFLAGGDQPAVLHAPSGLGLPPVLAMVGAVVFSGILGALLAPIAGRLRGIYLGLASIGLVFIGQHILFNAKGVTGGFNGRDAEPFSLFGFSFSNSDPDNLVVFGVPYGGLERLWYLGLLLVALSWWYAHNVTHSRPGRALLTIRDSPIAAAVMGVNVPVYRAAAFTVSAMYAGLAGVLLALAFGRIVPDSFGFLLSIDFLVMIVVGGLGSIGGAVVGALLVSALPQIFDHYSASLPLMGDPGGGGLQPAEAARFVYGAAVVAVLIFAPDGLSALGRRLAGRRRAAPALLRSESKESTA
jgi:branched-chain amino acid transport system permease protein